MLLFQTFDFKCPCAIKFLAGDQRKHANAFRFQRFFVRVISFAPFQTSAHCRATALLLIAESYSILPRTVLLFLSALSLSLRSISSLLHFSAVVYFHFFLLSGFEGACSVLSLSPFTLTCVTSLLTRPVCAAAIGPRFGDVSRRAGAAAVPPSARSSPASVRAPWQTTSHGCAVTWGCSRCPCFRVKQRVRFY